MYHLGGLNPWAREKWDEDERYIDTLYARREKLRSLAKRAKQLPTAEQERVSHDLVRLANEDSIVLIRIEAIRTLGAFPTPAASRALHQALKDSDTDVRIAAIEAWERRGGQEAFDALRGAVGSDADIDVRLAATRALATFQGPGTEQALAIALNDKDPALQYRAMESLRKVSRRDYGNNVVAWRDYVQGGNPPPPEQPSFAEQLRELF